MSVEPPTHEEIQIDDEVEEIEDEDEDEVDEEDVFEDEEEEEIEEVTHGRSTGRGLTLRTLMKEGILQPGEGLMTINYLVRSSSSSSIVQHITYPRGTLQMNSCILDYPTPMSQL